MQVQRICYKVQAFVLVFLKTICWGGERKSLNYLLKALSLLPLLLGALRCQHGKSLDYRTL